MSWQKPQTFRNVFSCERCDGSVCHPGAFLHDCGPRENIGSCSKCDVTPGATEYFSSGCTVAACDPGSCTSGAILIGCGHGQPGKRLLHFFEDVLIQRFSRKVLPRRERRFPTPQPDKGSLCFKEGEREVRTFENSQK